MKLKSRLKELRGKYPYLNQDKVQEIIDKAYLAAQKIGGHKHDNWIYQRVEWDILDLNKAYHRRLPKKQEEVTAQPKEPVTNLDASGLGEYSMSDMSNDAERRVVLKEIIELIPDKDKPLLIKFLLDRPMTRTEQRQLERLTGFLRGELGDDP